MEIITRQSIKKLPIVKHPMPPNFVNLRSGRHAVYPGGGWYLVADDVTRKDIESRWRTFKPKATAPVPKGDTWPVTGSKGKEYTVSFLNMNWTCTCPGFGFRRKCKHIDAIKANQK